MRQPTRAVGVLRRDHSNQVAILKIPLAAAAMTPAYFTGLDLHKRSITATTLDAAGTVVATAKRPCRPKALLAYFAQTPGEHAATVECTSGWYWVRDALGTTVDLHLAHAKGVKAISAAKVKTDSADAAMLAHLLRTDLLPHAHMISDEMRPLRDVLQTRLRLVERRVSAQNSIARLLEKHNARDVAELDAFGRLQAETHIEQAELLHAQIKRLEKSLHPHLVPDADVQRLLRIPGIGKAVAFSVRLEVDDIARFETDRQFFSYCRVVPGASNSGERVRHKRSRDGNRYLKLAFSHAAVRAIQYYPEVRAPTHRRWVGYGTKKRRKPDVVARALVAKEIARIVYHVLVRSEDRTEAPRLQRPVQGHAPEPSEEGAMAPSAKPGQHNWRRRTASSRGNSTALGGNGKRVVGPLCGPVPPAEIWDGAADVCPSPSTAVRARTGPVPVQGVWPASALRSDCATADPI